MPVFLDTNILLYAVSSAQEEANKTEIARRLLEESDWQVSVQVLQEFYVNAVRKLTRPVSEASALKFIRILTRQEPIPVDLRLMLRGIQISSRYQLSYWDGAVVAAAQISDCATLYSEDLNHGQRFEQVSVINPFVAD